MHAISKRIVLFLLATKSEDSLDSSEVCSDVPEDDFETGTDAFGDDFDVFGHATFGVFVPAMFTSYASR